MDQWIGLFNLQMSMWAESNTDKRTEEPMLALVMWHIQETLIQIQLLEELWYPVNKQRSEEGLVWWLTPAMIFWGL
jgi:hypothetical protein